MSETLQFTAEIVDKFSKPLQDLRKHLGEVKPPPTLRAMSQEFERVQRTVQAATREIGQGFSAVTSGLGISSLGAAVSIAGITAAVRKFSESTIEMRQFERATGVSTEALRQLKQAADGFGANKDAIAPAIKNFASHLYDMKRGIDPAISELLTAGEGDLVRKLRDTKKPAADALKDVLDAAAKSAEQGSGGAERARRMLNVLGLDELAPMILRGRKALNEVWNRRVAPITGDDERKAIAFAEAMDKVDKAVTSVGKSIAVAVTPAITEAAKQFDDWLNKEGGIGKLNAGIREAGRALSDIAGAFKAIREMADAIEKSAVWKFLMNADKAGGDAMSKAVGSLRGLPGSAGIGASAPDALRRLQVLKNIGEIDRAIDRTYGNPDDAAAAKRREELTGRRDALQREYEALNRKIEGGAEKGAAKGTKDGAKEGVQQGLEQVFQKMSLAREGGAFGGASVQRASYGGGRGSRGGFGRDGDGAGQSSGGEHGAGQGNDVGSEGPVRRAIEDTRRKGAEAIEKSPAGRAMRDVQRKISGGASSDSNDFFDAIIKAEGTGKHGNPYDTSLGYLKSPKPLSQMTMDEALAWGDHIRKNTAIGQRTNSSAKGAFQIVNTTQRAAMKALGMSGDEMFSPENQRRMASWIARKQGLGAWEGFKHHSDQLARARHALADGQDRDVAARQKRMDGVVAQVQSGGGYPVGWYDRAARKDAAGGQRPWGDLDGENKPRPRLSDPDADVEKVSSRGARMDIHLHGFPKGTRTNSDGGSLFRDVNVQRGRSMAIAGEDV